MLIAVVIVLLAACSGDDERTERGEGGPGSDARPPVETTTTDSADDPIGTVPPDGDIGAPDGAPAGPSPTIRPGPAQPSVSGPAPTAASPPGSSPSLGQGLVEVLVAGGRPRHQAECIADGVFARFRAVELTLAVNHLSNPEQHPAASVADPLAEILTACSS